MTKRKMEDREFDGLLEEARAHEVDTSRIAYGLETRVTARLLDARPEEIDPWRWAAGLVWRSALGLMAVTAAFVIWGVSQGGLESIPGSASVEEVVGESMAVSLVSGL